jgi:hypothetical protein
MDTTVVRGYFNNYYGAKAVANGIEFKEMLGEGLSDRQKEVKEKLMIFIDQSNWFWTICI